VFNHSLCRVGNEDNLISQPTTALSRGDVTTRLRLTTCSLSKCVESNMIRKDGYPTDDGDVIHTSHLQESSQLPQHSTPLSSYVLNVLNLLPATFISITASYNILLFAPAWLPSTSLRSSKSLLYDALLASHFDFLPNCVLCGAN
jgi:hypothetical protein